MAYVDVTGSALGNPLQQLLSAKAIEPGSAPSYQTCKTIYEFHPLGAKMAEGPIKIAQSQEREIEIPGAPDVVKEAFLAEQLRMGTKRLVRNTVKTARIYGISSVAAIEKDADPAQAIDLDKVHDAELTFNVLDPLNTAGSLVMSQDPNAADFQKANEIQVNGVAYHRSRTCIVLNEEPVYISFTSSAFGFVGRSVYQRALYPLKSFVQSMRTDDLVIIKAGVFVAKMKQVSSAVNQLTQRLFGGKRDIVKEAVTGNVISIGVDEAIETLDMTNLDKAFTVARNDVLKNIAVSMDAPAKFMDGETMVEGFGEGTEDAKNMARFVDGIREDCDPVYAFFDRFAMHRAWNPKFYKTVQQMFPDRYGKVSYDDAFYEWRNAYKATWPSLLIEPDSKRAEADKVKHEAIMAVVAALIDKLDPENKARLLEWVEDNLNAIKMIFPVPLELDLDAFLTYVPPNLQPSADEEIDGEGIAPAGDMPGDGSADDKVGREPAAPRLAAE